MPRLTPKQRRFAEIYDGNGRHAARDAGYKGNGATLSQIALKNLSNPRIKSLIEGREREFLDGKIATRQNRQEFWTKVMYDDRESMASRLRASNLLGKSEADFVDRQEIKTEGTTNAVLIIPGITPKEWEEMFEKKMAMEEE